MPHRSRMLHILAISGSLRANSFNTALLRAALELGPPNVKIDIYNGIAALPHFNPDYDCEPALEPVKEWRAQLQTADAILIASPEYAHGVPGALKNALDWVVASGELSGKPVAVLHTSPRAQHAPAALQEILTTMDARLDMQTGIALALPVTNSKLDAAGIFSDGALCDALRNALFMFIKNVRNSLGPASVSTNPDPA
jgi:chromate reductase, NAD(P)H dehydrogenase (quinone)